MSMIKDLLQPESDSGVELIAANDLMPNPENFYGLRDIEELANSILANGLEQNLVVTPAGGGKYRILTGGRRYAANELNRGKGCGLEELPCIVRPAEEPAAEMLRLITTNQHRELNDYERVQQVARAYAAVKELREKGVEKVGGLDIETLPPRNAVAAITGMAIGSIPKYAAIAKNLYPPLMEWMKEERLPLTVAYELSRWPEKWQKEVAERKTGYGKVFGAAYKMDIALSNVTAIMERRAIETACTGWLGKEIDPTATAQQNRERIENEFCKRYHSSNVGPGRTDVTTRPGFVIVWGGDMRLPKIEIPVHRFFDTVAMNQGLARGTWYQEEQREKEERKREEERKFEAMRREEEQRRQAQTVRKAEAETEGHPPAPAGKEPDEAPGKPEKKNTACETGLARQKLTMEEEKLMAIAKLLKRYCMTQTCTECCFCDADNRACRLEQGGPEAWDI